MPRGSSRGPAAPAPRNLTLAIIEADLRGRQGDVDRGETLLLGRALGEPRRAACAPGVGFLLQRARSASRSHPRAGVGAAAVPGRDVDPVPARCGPGAERPVHRCGAGVPARDRSGSGARAGAQLPGLHARRSGENGWDESVRLIARAVEKDPHNGSYLDSLGWAYYKLDRLDLAEAPLRAAGDQLQRNSVVQGPPGRPFSTASSAMPRQSMRGGAR